MPVYEYRCIPHGHRFDIVQPVGAPPPACPECGGETRKVYGSVGLIFKGSGFHVTDYRRGNAGSRNGEAAKTPEKTAGEAAAKSDTASAGGTGSGTSGAKTKDTAGGSTA